MAVRSRAPESVSTTLLLAGVLVLVVLAGLSLNFGVAPAKADCTYGDCPSGSGNTVWYGLAALLAAIIVVAAVIVLRRRSKPRAPPQEYAAPAAGLAAPAVAEEYPGTPESPPGAPAGGSEYLEGPEDVSAPMPTGTSGAAPAAEPDIDSLMQELDKISGEILTRGTPPKKGTPPPEGSDGEQGSQ